MIFYVNINSMKRLLWLILLLFLTQSAALCSETKFVVLSDVHISAAKQDKNSRQLTQSISLLQKAVSEVNKSDVDFVIFSGDVIDKTEKTSLVMFAKIVNKLNKPYYIIPGNHDVAHFLGLDKKEFFRLVNKFSHNKTSSMPSVKIMKNGLVFIFMDGVNQIMPSSAGYYKENDLIWLDKKLSKYKNNNVVIVQHFPLVEPYYRKSHITYKADEYLDVLSKHKNVIAVISGHFHAEGENLRDGVLHISAPSLVENNEYKEITIDQGIGKENHVIKSKVFSVQ